MKILCLTVLISMSVYAQNDSVESIRFAKDPSKAYNLSLLNTVLPVCVGFGLALYAGDWNTLAYSGVSLMAYGTIVGPSVGHFYSGNYATPWKGIILRGGAVILLAAGGRYVLAAPILAVAVISLGGGFIVNSAIKDIRTAKKSAEAFNNEHGLITLSPNFNPSTRVVGLQLSYVLR
ncbi:hypothetical protein JNM05_09605 [bacterium]|nr:hypothetical protein [bacterium]